MFSPQRKFSLVFVLLASGILLTGCSLTSSDDSGSGSGNSSSTSKECVSIGKEVSGNTDLEAILVSKSDYLPTSKTQFTMAEIVDYQYGMTGELGEEEYYGTYELCNVDTGEYLEEGDYEFEEFNLFEIKSNPNAVSEASGNQTDFIYTVEGEERNSIPGPGTYSINTFSASNEGGDWELTDSYQFVIVE